MRSFLHFLILVLAFIAQCPRVLSLHLRDLRRILVTSSFMGSNYILTPSISHAVDETAAKKALQNVMRVQYSMQYVSDQIASSSDFEAIAKDIGTLMNNYHLRENIANSVTLVSKEKRNEARAAGNTIIEDLSLVSEYFEDDVDDMTGKKRVPPGAYKFAEQVLRMYMCSATVMSEVI